jgi:hypothetical protein
MTARPQVFGGAFGERAAPYHLSHCNPQEAEMKSAVTMTLDRADAEILERSLHRRKERLCDIKQEICSPENEEPYEQEECAYFEREDEVVGRILEALRVALRATPAD